MVEVVVSAAVVVVVVGASVVVVVVGSASLHPHSSWLPVGVPLAPP